MKNVLIIVSFAEGFERYVTLCESYGWRAHVLWAKSPRTHEAPSDARAHFIEVPAIEQDVASILPLLPKGVVYDGVVPASELAVPLAAALAHELELPGGVEDPSVFREKSKMRACFARAGAPQPAIYARITTPAEMEAIDWTQIVFPVIVKPVDSGASLGVRRCDSKEEVLEHVPKITWARKNVFTGEQRPGGVALIEEFVDGREYSAECIVHRGGIVNFLVTEKFVSPFPACHEIGHLMRGDPGIDLDAVRDALERVISAWAVRDGVMHMEFKIDPKRGLRLIEVGNRVAGDQISDLARYRHGWALEEAFLRLRCGLDPRAAFHESTRRAYDVVGIKFYFHGETTDDLGDGIEVIEEKWSTDGGAKPHPDRYIVFNRVGGRIFGARNYGDACAYMQRRRLEASP